MFNKYLLIFFSLSIASFDSFATLYYCRSNPNYFTDEISNSEAWTLKCELVDGSPIRKESDPETSAIAQSRKAIPLKDRIAAIESKPSTKLRTFFRITERVFRVQQLAWTAGACGIRSLGWHMQVQQLYSMAYDYELTKQHFSIEELAVIYKHSLVTTQKAKADFPVDTGCIQLGRSNELAKIDANRQRATLNYH